MSASHVLPCMIARYDRTVACFIKQLQLMKQEAAMKRWLYIDVNAGEMLASCKREEQELICCCAAMYAVMLEGDRIQVQPKTKRSQHKLTIRYYVDNLRLDRRRHVQAEKEQRRG